MQHPGSGLRISPPHLPEGCGLLLYWRAGTRPWEVQEIVGDGPGVLGVPTRALRQVWSELLHPEDEPRLLAALLELGPGESTSLDYRIRTSLGGERWVRDTLNRMPGPRGLVFGTLTDVSGERALRAQISALEERIWRAQRMDSLGGLAAGIAHDLGSLLTAILSAVEVVEERQDLPADLREDLLVVREGARRGSDFVRQILRFAAREEHPSGPVDLNGIMEDLRVILDRSLGKDIRLTLAPAPELQRIHCDPAQMEQVILNLAVNAREAMSGGGELTISTAQTRLVRPLSADGVTLPAGEYVILSVSDTGCGIPARARRRIFEPFFSTKANPGTGSGFGLSTVQRIVTGYDGAVYVDSAEGKGATFRIYLPLRRARRGADGVFVADREGATLGRVLVAEADPAVRELLKRVLAREGYTVLSGGGTARETLRLLDRVRPDLDLLVSDLTLPDRSGMDLVRVLRNRSELLPVVYLVDMGEYVELPADDPWAVYLEKPFTASSLVEAVERALDGAPDLSEQEKGAGG